jgi:hypothetical protein
MEPYFLNCPPTSCMVLHCQLEAAKHNDRAPCEKAAHLISVLEGQAVDILQSVPARQTFKNIVGALKGRSGDHQLEGGLPVSTEGQGPAER